MAEVPPPKESKLFDVPGFKEMLFEQILGVDPNPFLTNRANIKPHPTTGKGGVQYDKKKTWLEKIIEPMKKTDEFKAAAWPEGHGPLAWHGAPNGLGEDYRIFGDSAYPLSTFLYRMYKGVMAPWQLDVAAVVQSRYVCRADCS